MTASDSWLLVAIRERVGDRYKKKKCGTLLYRYHIKKSIDKIYKQMKSGVEVAPLQILQKQRNAESQQNNEHEELKGLGCTHPSE